MKSDREVREISSSSHFKDIKADCSLCSLGLDALKKKKKDNIAGRRFCDKIYNKSANRTHESYTNLDLVAANSPDTSVQTSALL